VTAPDGRRIGVIRWPEQAVNFAFGAPDLKTLFWCAHTRFTHCGSRCRATRIPGISCAGSNRDRFGRFRFGWTAEAHGEESAEPEHYGKILSLRLLPSLGS
jgi:hypothetical protein